MRTWLAFVSALFIGFGLGAIVARSNVHLGPRPADFIILIIGALPLGFLIHDLLEEPRE